MSSDYLKQVQGGHYNGMKKTGEEDVKSSKRTASHPAPKKGSKAPKKKGY